ncbi:MAG TPA: alpha/beta hydrolase [Acidobacteriaceae bacterium]|nr:alpha/beta hydrolase [Acidobacteriaceae bacterium]
MRILSLSLLLTLALTSPAFSQTTTPLWPGTPPGAPNVSAGQQEHDTTTPADNLIAGKRVARIGFVSKPTLTFYPAFNGKNTGATIVVLPGGAYRILAYDLEGTEVCEWLNGIGVNCALVKYRVPDAGPFPKFTQDLADAQRAVRIVRQHASAWQLDANRVGVLGFSASGHIVAVLGSHASDAIYPAIDDADKLSARPDFTLLIYPAYLDQEVTPLAVRPEVKPVALTPPSFLIQAEDDPVKVENALSYYEALKQAKVPAEMHLFANGGHGYGLRPTKLPITHWPELAATWLRTLGITTP